jgi:hypothetical protein
MDDYRKGKLIYHLTSLKNLNSILENGLLPRNQLSKFTDIADAEIIECRNRNNLDSFVPFHFFPKNPFDDRVQKEHRGENFIIITLKRDHARAQNFKILTQHPLSLQNIELLDYDDGINSINWDILNKRDYYNNRCKQICMAECLVDRPISPNEFNRIFVKNATIQKQVEEANNKRFSFLTSVCPGMYY